MKTVGLAAAACALLVVLTGCGGGPAYSETAQRSTTSSASEKVARSAGPVSRGGERKPLGDGLTITVSAPKSFVPTDSAAPVAPRAVGFEMTLENDGPSSYRPTLLSLSARANGTVTQQVIDSTQGYGGVVVADDIPPGRTVRFSVAFAVPAEKAVVQVGAQPDPAGGATVTVFDAVV